MFPLIVNTLFSDPGWGRETERHLSSSGLSLHEESNGVPLSRSREDYQSKNLPSWCRKWGQSYRHNTTQHNCFLFTTVSSVHFGKVHSINQTHAFCDYSGHWVEAAHRFPTGARGLWKSVQMSQRAAGDSRLRLAAAGAESHLCGW